MNGALIPGARHHLSSNDFRALIEERLAQSDTSVELRTAFHIAGLQLAPDRHLAVLKTLSKTHSEVALAIRHALDVQDADSAKLVASSPSSVGQLIELLAIHAVESGKPREIEEDEFSFRGQGRTLHQLANGLSAESSLAAGNELRRLRSLKVMST